MKLTIEQLNEFIRDQVRRNMKANTNLGRLSEALEEDLTELFAGLKEENDSMDEQAAPMAPPPAAPMPIAPAAPPPAPMAADPFAVPPPAAPPAAPGVPMPGMPAPMGVPPAPMPGMPAPGMPAGPAGGVPAPQPMAAPMPGMPPAAPPMFEHVVRRIVRQKVLEHVQKSGPVYSSERWKRLANIKK